MLSVVLFKEQKFTNSYLANIKISVFERWVYFLQVEENAVVRKEKILNMY